MTLKTRISMASATVGMTAIAGMAVLTSFAAAAVTPSVTGVLYNNSGNPITTALVGTSVHAVATVASSTASTSPTGTVDFNVYNNTSCSGSPTAQTGVPLVLGQATSSDTVLPIGGLSYMIHYSGQGDMYSAGNSACIPVAATQSATAVSLSLSNTNVQAGSYVYGIPTLTNETGTASGTLQYRVYSNNSCTNLVLGPNSKTVTNGSTPNSDSWQFITPGTYYWQVGYSGDLNNTPATSTCNAGGTVLTVVATSSTPTTTPATPGTISGTLFNDLNKNDKQDNGEAGLAGWTVWLHKAPATSSEPWYKKIFKNTKQLYNAPIIATATTDSNGNYSFGNLAAGTYLVEESVMTGWKQTSSDTKVVLTANKTSADVDFSNIQKNATSTNNGKGKGADKDDDWHDNGNHNGWFKINGNIFGWLKFSQR